MASSTCKEAFKELYQLKPDSSTCMKNNEELVGDSSAKMDVDDKTSLSQDGKPFCSNEVISNPSLVPTDGLDEYKTEVTRLCEIFQGSFSYTRKDTKKMSTRDFSVSASDGDSDKMDYFCNLNKWEYGLGNRCKRNYDEMPPIAKEEQKTAGSSTCPFILYTFWGNHKDSEESTEEEEKIEDYLRLKSHNSQRNKNTRRKSRKNKEEDDEYLPPKSHNSQRNQSTRRKSSKNEDEDDEYLPPKSHNSQRNKNTRKKSNKSNDEEDECLPSTSYDSQKNKNARRKSTKNKVECKEDNDQNSAKKADKDSYPALVIPPKVFYKQILQEYKSVAENARYEFKIPNFLLKYDPISKKKNIRGAGDQRWNFRRENITDKEEAAERVSLLLRISAERRRQHPPHEFCFDEGPGIDVSSGKSAMSHVVFISDSSSDEE